MFLIREGILDEKGINELEKQVDDDLQDATDRALAAALPTPDTVLQLLYSPDLDPTSAPSRPKQCVVKLERRGADGRRRHAQDHGRSDQRHSARRDAARRAHRDLRRRRRRLQPRGISAAETGQRARAASSSSRLACSASSAPTASSIRRWPKPTSSAAPPAWRTRGLKPVVEIQFFDYIWPAMMQLRDELPLIRWRSNNGFSVAAGDSRAPSAAI